MNDRNLDTMIEQALRVPLSVELAPGFAERVMKRAVRSRRRAGWDTPALAIAACLGGIIAARPVISAVATEVAAGLRQLAESLPIHNPGPVVVSLVVLAVVDRVARPRELHGIG